MALHSIPAVSNSADIWVLVMSLMPKSSIDLMSHLGIVSRAPITTSLHDGLSLPQMRGPDTSQLSSPLF